MLGHIMTQSKPIFRPSYVGLSQPHQHATKWVPVSLTGKASNGCIKDKEFNPRLHQKLIGVLV